MKIDIDGYAPDRELPVRSYAILLSVHALLIGGFLALRRASGEGLPRRVPLQDLALLGVGTWRATRVVTKDLITSPIRAPFTRVESIESRSDVKEKPRGRGLRKAIGELLTCPYCMGSWIAAAFVALYVVAPRTARFLGSILTVQVVSNELNRRLR